MKEKMTKQDWSEYLIQLHGIEYPELVIDKVIMYTDLYGLSFQAGEFVIGRINSGFAVIPTIAGYRKVMSSHKISRLEIFPLFQGSGFRQGSGGEIVVETKISEDQSIVSCYGVIEADGVTRDVYMTMDEAKDDSEYWESMPVRKLINACEKALYRAIKPDLFKLTPEVFESEQKEMPKKKITEIMRKMAVDPEFREKHLGEKRLSSCSKEEVERLYELAIMGGE